MDEDGGSVTPSVGVTRSRHVPRAVLTTSLPQGRTVLMGEHECLPDRSGPHVKTSRWVWRGIFCTAMRLCLGERIPFPMQRNLETQTLVVSLIVPTSPRKITEPQLYFACKDGNGPGSETRTAPSSCSSCSSACLLPRSMNSVGFPPNMNKNVPVPTWLTGEVVSFFCVVLLFKNKSHRCRVP